VRSLIAHNQRQLILDQIPEQGKMLEWGCGGSTIWFLSQRSDFALVSIEHNKKWAKKVNKQVKRRGFLNRHNLILRQGRYIGSNGMPFEENPSGLSEYILPPVKMSEFDVILVDGVARGSCLAVMRNSVKSGTNVFLHDAQRKWYQWAQHFYPVAEIIKPTKGDYPADLWRCVA